MFCRGPPSQNTLKTQQTDKRTSTDNKQTTPKPQTTSSPVQMQLPPTPSTREHYSRLCALQMSHIRNAVGSEELHAFAKRNKSFMHSKREREHSYADMVSANKERCYEIWCKIQLDEILAKTDASSVIANSSNLFGTEHRKKKNAYYLCSRCGKPKKGHICKANISGTNISNSTNASNGTRQHEEEDDDDEEEEYKVDPNDPEYEDEEIPEDDEEEYPCLLFILNIITTKPLNYLNFFFF
jgi:hypothetical protein